MMFDDPFNYPEEQKRNTERAVSVRPQRLSLLVQVCSLPDEITGDARAADAFPRHVRKQLSDPAKDWTLEARDSNTWVLCRKKR